MITASQFIGKSLIATTAITSIVTSDRIRHGLRPVGTVLPAINYYNVSNYSSVLSNETWSINCRSNNIDQAMSLAKSVKDLFCGVNNLGTTATESVSGVNVFNAARISLGVEHRAIPESDGAIWNKPIDIVIVY